MLKFLMFSIDTFIYLNCRNLPSSNKVSQNTQYCFSYALCIIIFPMLSSVNEIQSENGSLNKAINRLQIVDVYFTF